MNALAEALGLALPGSAAIPAPYRERGQAAYATGQRIVEMVWEDLKPSDILTREAFENAIVANAAIGGSTNAPIHINAIAKHIGVPLSCDDWERVGFEIPLLVDMQPAGRWLGEEYFRAGGLPAVFAELIEAGKVHEGALTCNGRTVGENYRGRHSWNRDVIRAYGEPLMERAGFLNLKGSLFDSAIMKTCVISEEFAARYLRNPADPMAFEGRVIVFDGPEDYHHRIDDPALDIDENTILIMRGAGPIGYPGAAEVVNMQPPGRADPPRRDLPALHRRRAPIRHLRHPRHPQRVAGGGGGGRPGAAADRRPDPGRSQPAQRRHPAPARGTGAPPGRSRGARRLPVPGLADALAGDLPRPGRPAGSGHGAEGRGEVPEGRADLGRAAGQSLSPPARAEIAQGVSKDFRID